MAFQNRKHQHIRAITPAGQLINRFKAKQACISAVRAVISAQAHHTSTSERTIFALEREADKHDDDLTEIAWEIFALPTGSADVLLAKAMVIVEYAEPQEGSLLQNISMSLSQEILTRA